MNLHNLVDQYVAYRRALGERYDSQNRTLRQFCRKVGPTTDIRDVDEEQVTSYLAGNGPITHSWHCRHDALIGFYRYAVSRDYVSSAPLPAYVPKRPPKFVPYIYTCEELQCLLKATFSYQRNRSCIEPITIRTILLLLYGAALRIAEATALKYADVNFDDLLITIRGTKFYKTRQVPIGPKLNEALRVYSKKSNLSTLEKKGDNPFFTTRKGDAVNKYTVEGCFRRLCEHARIRRSDNASYQPRLHDIRHTAAVHRLIYWYRKGLDVQKLLPYLSTYMGHVNLTATQVYLSMTPELLLEASKRFEYYTME